MAAVIVQSPNFFGCLEQIDEIAELAHAVGALLIVAFTEAVSLGILEPPRAADIVVGELQSFAISPSYGGPYAGIIATKERYVRQLPGRLVGETVDSEGRRAFCLTLATREQHIRREKATSNICTNQALLASDGDRFHDRVWERRSPRARRAELSKAHYLASKLPLRFDAPFFNEFVASANCRSAKEINQDLLEHRIVGGLALGQILPGTLRMSAALCDRNDQTR